ncbi:precorrin-2 C(20)-methyltransferase [Effusibacillus lacus]|uniref:Precorrin-2 C(20)-methyltransferase n=1 Tax=Effusibacillus lacus TaxID=1348429 RepID=A0A292YRB1_9BACL|nr:precorrin-2 C(20)-methyltransferase [Effusibacillus lacus]TCS75706.1 precorrin-2/cobalt-factor-2 C20-methyltransferase [Effusibacillus lacus]GAX91025.1 precorrin-2 C(20)-methyltransferase [Effusibacillus lacus]
MTTGKLYAMGVGPGDKELITLKAYRVLAEADVIAYPRKLNGDSYALSIVEEHLPEGIERLGLHFPMTRDQELLKTKWEAIVQDVWDYLAQGKNVAFITEGDPYLYSTAIHLTKLMKERHPEVEMEVVPGVSSINGAATRLDIPLADGDQQLGVIPATYDMEAMRKALEEHDTVVFLKVAKVLTEMIGLLKEMDLIDKATVVTKAGSPDEVVYRNVAALEGEELEYLTLMIVKKC